MRRPILLFSLVLVALVAALAATRLLIQPPPVREAAIPGQFDANRAKARLAAILGNEQPHPADSFGDDAVRARLIGQIRVMGLTPIVRNQFACNAIYKQRGVTCARVRNVIVTLGPASGKALLLNAHYDSTPVGPAAADDGVGVATLLEVMSILKDCHHPFVSSAVETPRRERPSTTLGANGAGCVLRGPLIFLFNEGEELGLVGARAFLEDPLSRRVDSLVNLEARGVSGPVTMFETSLPNGPPVRAFARSVNRPFANSLATDFYRQLPNYTDVNSFSERGWLTLNLAMIGNETRYHSPGDTVAALDLESLQHMGDQTLALARELQQPPVASGTVLFTDIAGKQLVMIPQWFGFALLGLLLIGFAVISFRRGGIWRGLLLFFAATAAAAALAWLGMLLMGVARPGAFWRAYPIWTQLAVYACGLLAAVAFLALVGRRLTMPQLRASFWLFFLALGAAVLVIAPGGVIYFLLPSLVAISGILLRQERTGAIIAALLLWLTLGEVLALLGELLSNGPFFILAPLALIVAMPWLIEAKPLIEKSRPAAIAAAALLMLAGWTAAAAAPAYSADRQQRFVIQHVSNAVTGRAYWLVTNDGAPLPKHFGKVDGWHRDEFPYLERKGWIAPAPSLPRGEPPRLQVLRNASHGHLRTVTFRIVPNGAESVTLIGTKDAQIVSAGSGSFVRPIERDAKGRYFLTCFGRSCSGATMQFTTKVRQRMGFTLVGSNRGLPPSAAPLLHDRPPLARPQYAPDSTLVISRVWL